MKNILLCLVLLVTASANAGLISIGSGSTIPGDCTIGCMKTYQQAYDSSYFGSSVVSLDDLSIFGSSGAHGTYDISVGYMNGNFNSITTNFSSNFAFAPVYTDSVNLATDMTGNILTVNLGFDYDTSLGDLLIQFTRTSATSSGNFAASSGYAWSRVYEWPNGSTHAHSGYALNSSFNVSTVEVPEPGSMVLLGLCMGCLGLFRTKSNI